MKQFSEDKVTIRIRIKRASEESLYARNRYTHRSEK